MSIHMPFQTHNTILIHTKENQRSNQVLESEAHVGGIEDHCDIDDETPASRDHTSGTGCEFDDPQGAGSPKC